MSYDDGDALGFKKPPRWSQFKPGQSGNPKGRPKRKAELAQLSPVQSELDELLRSEFDRVVTINERGMPKKVKVRELVPRSQINSAIKGNSNAQYHVMKAMHGLETRDAERALAQAEHEKAEREEEIASYKHMIKYKKLREAEWAEAEAQGVEPHEPWPHPNDILLFPKEQRWQLRGPSDKRHLAIFNWYRAERDYLFA